MGVAETFLHPDDGFAIAAEAEMPRFDNAGVDGPDENLVESAPFGRQEGVGLGLFLRPVAVVEPGPRIGQALGLQPEQVADGAVQPDRGRVQCADRRKFPVGTSEACDQDFTGRSHIDQAFAKAGALPDVVLTAIDADVIKTYVELGMGIGVVAAMAYDPKRDTELVALDTQHLFEASTTRVGLRKGAFLRAYAYRLLEMFAPQLKEADIAAQLREVA